MPILQEVESSQASRRRTKRQTGLVYTSVAVAATLILVAAALYVNWKPIGLKLTSLSGHALYVEGPARQVATIGDVIELRAKLTAIGPQDVAVVGARLPCGCLEINPMPVQIPAGEMKEVVILFDTSDR